MEKIFQKWLRHGKTPRKGEESEATENRKHLTFLTFSRIWNCFPSLSIPFNLLDDNDQWEFPVNVFPRIIEICKNYKIPEWKLIKSSWLLFKLWYLHILKWKCS